MGYYTEYRLTIQNYSGTKADMVRVLKDHGVYGLEFDEKYIEYDTAKKIMYFWPTQEVKWYSAKTDIEEVAKLFPDVSFRLMGRGEDFFDVWEYYVCFKRPVPPKRKYVMLREFHEMHASPPSDVPWNAEIDMYLVNPSFETF